jgi:hypothetical protein
MSDADAFRDVVDGLMAGDFSRLEPEFRPAADGSPGRVVRWFEAGRFDGEAGALAEAFTCACFLGRTDVAEAMLARGVGPAGGSATGMDALHWAVNRGQVEVVEQLLSREPDLESRNAHGTTALGTALWSAIHEPRAGHPVIVERLLAAGSRVDGVGYPTGNAEVDAILRRDEAG